jgi:hypothetical protein
MFSVTAEIPLIGRFNSGPMRFSVSIAHTEVTPRLRSSLVMAEKNGGSRSSLSAAAAKPPQPSMNRRRTLRRRTSSTSSLPRLSMMRSTVGRHTTSRSPAFTRERKSIPTEAALATRRSGDS